MMATGGGSRFVRAALQLAVLAVIDLPGPGGCYQCDPGRFNASARAPCPGWRAGLDTNWSLCELELGCCWELVPERPGDQSSIACYAPLISAPGNFARKTASHE